MSLEIISIPFAKLEKNGWFLHSYVIDLNVKSIDVTPKVFPIRQAALLPIGIEIDKGMALGKTNGIQKRYRNVNFSGGINCCLEDISENIYSFEVPSLLKRETMMYSINIQGRKTLFFSFELFRQFLGSDPRICQYIFEHDMLDMFIDNDQITQENGKTKLSLKLNSHLKLSHARNNSFKRNMILLLYHKELRRYWKQLQAATHDSKNNFGINNIPFKQLSFDASIRSFPDFDLVYHIKSIKGFKFPFDHIEVTHPKYIEAGEKGNDRSQTTRKLTEENPTELNIDENEGAANSNKETQVSINAPGIKFDEDISMDMVKTKKSSSSNRSEETPSIFTEFKLNEMALSFNNSDDSGTATAVTLEDVNESSSFDFTQIPVGLQLFCNAITVLHRLIKVKFEYEIIDFPEESTFSFTVINGKKRKALLVTFPSQPNIYVLEVDNSDDKYISTLLFKNFKNSKKEFLGNVLGKMAKQGGKWDLDYLKSNCISETLRHPRKLSKYNLMSNDEINKSVEHRIAFNLINILS